jgi:hypothetical protein
MGPPPSPPPAGLTGLVGYYPFELYSALVDPAQTRVAATIPAPANSPRQKDTYIIISAGIDRVYGTYDDITNFDGFQ